EGKGTRENDNPFNGGASQGLTSTGAEAGVEQQPVCVRKGETYFGSLWARGEAPGGLVVRLVSDGATLDETRLPAPADEWHEYTFEFKPKETAEKATLQVGVRGSGTVKLDQVSLMSQAARAAGGFRPDLLKAVDDLRPPVIRWP